ncbi:MAG TPA: hypothetical protein V6D33_11895 [Cyanophyceae cyanobacterium]
MPQLPPLPINEPACLVQYQTGEIQDLTYLCGQLEKQQRAREEVERNLTSEQRQLIEQQRRLLQEQTERSRQRSNGLIQQGIQITK